MQCDYTVLFSADLSLRWIVQCSGTVTPKHVQLLQPSFSSSTWKREVGCGCANYRLISQERLNIEVKLLLSSNMPRQLEQQRMTLRDIE